MKRNTGSRGDRGGHGFVAALLLATLANAPGSQAEEGKTPPAPGDPAGRQVDTPGGLPPGVVAEVNGARITTEDYQRFLYHLIGKQQVETFIDRILVREDARGLGIDISYAEIEAATRDRLEKSLRFFGGDRKAYAIHLAKTGRTLEGQLERLRAQELHRLALERCIVRSRDLSDESLRREFEARYGKYGGRVRLRHILLRLDGPVTSAVPTERQELARKIRSDALKSGDFAALAREHSEEEETAAQGGLIADYRPGDHGETFRHEAEQLLGHEVGAISDIFRDAAGLHLLQYAGVEKVDFDAVKSALRAELENRAPTDGERRDYLAMLRKRARVEK